jgi:hypothetical protein
MIVALTKHICPVQQAMSDAQEPPMNAMQLTLLNQYRDCFQSEDQYRQVSVLLACRNRKNSILEIWKILAGRRGQGLHLGLIPVTRWLLSGEMVCTKKAGWYLKRYIPYLVKDGHWDEVIVAANYIEEFARSKLWCKCLARAISQDRMLIVEALVEMSGNYSLEEHQRNNLSDILHGQHEGEIPLRYLIALEPLYRNTAEMIWPEAPLPFVEYMHQRNLIDDTAWSNILAEAIVAQETSKYHQLWAILVHSKQGVPNDHDLELLFQGLLWCRELNIPLVLELLERFPELIQREDHELLQRIIRAAREEENDDPEDLAMREQMRDLITTILRDYPIDLIAGDFKILRECCDAKTIQLLASHTQEHDVCYRGSRVHYRGTLGMAVIGCEQELPIYGWHTILLGGHYLYFDQIRLDAQRGVFIKTDDYVAPLEILDGVEPLEISFGANYQERMLVTPCALIEQYCRSLLGTRSKSARSAI